MSVQHFKSLLFKSTRIQQEIDREHQRRWPDWMRLLKLKKIRLAIKDRMQRLLNQGLSGSLQPVRVKIRSDRNGQFQGV